MKSEGPALHGSSPSKKNMGHSQSGSYALLSRSFHPHPARSRGRQRGARASALMSRSMARWLQPYSPARSEAYSISPASSRRIMATRRKARGAALYRGGFPGALCALLAGGHARARRAQYEGGVLRDSRPPTKSGARTTDGEGDLRRLGRGFSPRRWAWQFVARGRLGWTSGRHSGPGAFTH